ncbi:alpha-L-rhamnosidase [Granulicella aggregans]|uniref:alpha-L-rhamnosidase n=1 Tax=Granulicella aggregans TaxID=474949 RepID=A0A7W7ZG16_9BACT|nr:alpha-L-rhamnosidase [Granulicella aggregans]MBB5059260.1 alpha-L-rhamnosidase [Granulicella aggregans]
MAAVNAAKPAGLRCDSLLEPLGIDTSAPVLSWRLIDSRQGAMQTAYEVTVSTSASGKADVWDSGKIASSQSAGIPYGGPALQPSHRYFWRVQVWDKDGKPYPVSDASWWETGLMDASNWKAMWIGHEPDELHALRNSGAPWITNAKVSNYSASGDTHHEYRFQFSPAKTVARADLYTTGEDATAAWVNGKQVRVAGTLPKWKQTPWGTYEMQDVTTDLSDGKNVVAVEVTHFNVSSRAMGAADTQTPMSMCLYLVYKDGTTELLSSASPGWKASLDQKGNWYAAEFNDATWAPAEAYAPHSDQFGATTQGLPWPAGPVSALRRTFDERKPIASARLYATAMGAYKFHLNGEVVGDQVLAPGWMDFREHVPYQVYDVTKQVKQGKNAIAAYLAPGWYSTPLMWFRQGNNYGTTQPAIKAQLRVEHTDGSVEWIATDELWKAETSPTAFAEIYDGETYDARLFKTGWDTASFADSTWKSVTLVNPHEPKIVSQYFQPIREESVMTAKAITNPAPGVYIYDFGQNMSAVPKLMIAGKRGQNIRLRFAEVLNEDGTMYTENLRTAKATDHFILAGTGKPETWQPQFTYHGFRYLEITGVDVMPTLDTVKVAVLHTAAPFTTEFATGDTMVNKLWSNVLWGQRSNFVGVPTDCPQRDERLGWSADAQVFWRTAAFNMDLTTFSQKYASDLQGTQASSPMYGIFAPGTSTPNPGYGAAWSDAGVIVPWTGWIQSGNPKIIDENWDGMVKYLTAIEKGNPDFLWRNGFGAAFGDWLTPTITTPEDLVATAYWAYDVSMMRDMALATKRTAEAEQYAAMFAKIKTAFQKAYIHSDGFVGANDAYPSIPPPTMAGTDVSTDKNRVIETQTGYVLALHMRLMPEELRSAAAAKLVKKIEENHWLLGTGFLGTPYLLEVLSDTGHSDVAYRLLLNKDYPSWGYLIDHGATTTWERWNGDTMRNDPSMNSYNHYAYGAVAEWMYRYAAGIDTVSNDAGFHTIALHPNFDARLGHLDFTYQSPYGPVKSSWKIAGDQVAWELTIPPNTTAQLPVISTNATAFTLNGELIGQSAKVHAMGDGVYELAAGNYSFKAKLAQASTSAAATK